MIKKIEFIKNDEGKDTVVIPISKLKSTILTTSNTLRSEPGLIFLAEKINELIDLIEKKYGKTKKG